MNFDFFLDKLAFPLIIGGAIFLLSQFISNFATTEDLYKHKIENAQQISEINVKLDYLVKTNTEIKENINYLVKRIR